MTASVKGRSRAYEIVGRLSLLLPGLSLCGPGCSAPQEGRFVRSGASQSGAGDTGSASLRLAAVRAMQRAAGYDFVADANGIWRSRAGRRGATAQVEATDRGIRFSAADDAAEFVRVETVGLGRDRPLHLRGALERNAEGQELVFDGGGVQERYLVGPLGVEHSFVVSQRPGGSGWLAIDVTFEGLTAEREGEASDRVLLRDGAGRLRGGYRDLVATDAHGRSLEVRMDVRAAGVSLRVEDSDAVYPLTVDPVLWAQQAELTASDGSAYDGFGYSVSVSGGTAIVGAYEQTLGTNGDQGAAYIFAQTGGAWTQQAELTASDGATGDLFGESVSVSGGMAIVGAPGHTVGSQGGQGVAYIFGQSGTAWTQQAELTASDGAAQDAFGSSASLSGGTAIVGARGHAVASHGSQGAAYIFGRSGGAWTQQAELTASDGAANDDFGSSVSVSGGTAIVAAAGHAVAGHMGQGVAYIFTQGGSAWTEEAELAARDGVADDFFGTSVSVSGGTALVGAEQHTIDNIASQGAAYAFATCSPLTACPAGNNCGMYQDECSGQTLSCGTCMPSETCVQNECTSAPSDGGIDGMQAETDGGMDASDAAASPDGVAEGGSSSENDGGELESGDGGGSFPRREPSCACRVGAASDADGTDAAASAVALGLALAVVTRRRRGAILAQTTSGGRVP